VSELRIGTSRYVHGYFDSDVNDVPDYAPRNALRLRELAS